MTAVVIARAHGGEPVRMIAFGRRGRVVYVANPSRVDAINTGDSEPIGFPAEDVFRFDETLYQQLRADWEHLERALQQGEPGGERRLPPLRPLRTIGSCLCGPENQASTQSRAQ